MKITKQQIRRIVEEEIKNILLEDDKPKKDACYRKIKRAVKEKGGTWPSAYASGRLVQCRDKGAANWKEGETKKENIVYNRLRQMVEQEISNLNEKKKKKKKKNTLGDWFDQQGPPGPEGGWVDCNTCRKDKKTGRKKCKKCGRDTGEKRAKYPKCRPTPSACSKPGNYGKKSKAGKKG